MDMNDVLLTDIEVAKYIGLSREDDITLCKAQCLKLLNMLNTRGMIKHSYTPRYCLSTCGGFEYNGEEHSYNCELCEIEKLLNEKVP